VPPGVPFTMVPLPPWLVLAGLLGVINAAACFMLIGNHLSRLGWYIMLGVFAAALGQVVGDALEMPAALAIGDVNVVAASVGAWSVLLVARVVAR
jgi:hypothetical protein